MSMRVGRWYWQVCLIGALSMLGCDSGSEKAPKSLAELGIDDGASAGIETSAVVTGEEDVVMELATGARVKVPQGAVDKELTLGLKRPADPEALALIKSLPSKNKVASAPYVVTPHGTKFKVEVEVTLPVAKDRDGDKLKVVWLEDEKDTHWKELSIPQVNGKKAVVRVDHFSVLLLVEGENTLGAPQPGQDEDDEDASTGGTNAPGEDNRDAGAAHPDAGPGEVDLGDRPMLTAFPLDLTTQCPAGGCTIDFEPLEDGVWLDCVNGEPIPDFDLETFDFVQACAEATASSKFVHAGQTKRAELDFCDTWTEAFDNEGRLWEFGCSDTYVGMGLDDRSLRGADGRLYQYDYDDCEGTCSASLWVSVLDPADTTERDAQCATAAELYDDTCAIPVALPFGPAGVGAAAPAALTSTLWIRCDGSAVNPQESCAAVLADPMSQDYLRVARFKQNGTLDEITYDEYGDGWYAYCGVRAGVTGDRLRVFWCGEDAIEVDEITWEVQRIGGVDYLIWDDGDSDGPDVWVAAPGSLSLPDPDPCIGVEPASCVLH